MFSFSDVNCIVFAWLISMLIRNEGVSNSEHFDFVPGHDTFEDVAFRSHNVLFAEDRVYWIAVLLQNVVSGLSHLGVEVFHIVGDQVVVWMIRPGLSDLLVEINCSLNVFASGLVIINVIECFGAISGSSQMNDQVVPVVFDILFVESELIEKHIPLLWTQVGGTIHQASITQDKTRLVCIDLDYFGEDVF